MQYGRGIFNPIGVKDERSINYIEALNQAGANVGSIQVVSEWLAMDIVRLKTVGEVAINYWTSDSLYA